MNTKRIIAPILYAVTISSDRCLRLTLTELFPLLREEERWYSTRGLAGFSNCPYRRRLSRGFGWGAWWQNSKWRFVASTFVWSYPMRFLLME